MLQKKYKTGRPGYAYGTHEYICNECWHCNNDREVLMFDPEDPAKLIVRCVECGCRSLSEHAVKEGWDLPE